MFNEWVDYVKYQTFLHQIVSMAGWLEGSWGSIGWVVGGFMGGWVIGWMVQWVVVILGDGVFGGWQNEWWVREEIIFQGVLIKLNF